MTKRPKAKTPIVVVGTVVELMALLATLPPDKPLYRRGNMGDFAPGVGVVQTKLAQHFNKDEPYFANLDDPVWSRVQRNTFLEEFDATIIIA